MVEPERRQGVIRFEMPEDSLAVKHAARVLWQITGQLDLSGFTRHAGYNLQLAVAGSPMGGPRTIVGVRVTNVGSDMNSLTPMLDDIERRTGRLPSQLLADANHTAHEDIRAVSARGVELLAAVPDRTRNSRKAHDQVIADWLARMQTPEAKRTMRARASLCELANAHFKDRFGLDRILVRAAAKVTCVALLGALTFNLLQHAARMLS